MLWLGLRHYRHDTSNDMSGYLVSAYRHLTKAIPIGDDTSPWCPGLDSTAATHDVPLEYILPQVHIDGNVLKDGHDTSEATGAPTGLAAENANSEHSHDAVSETG